MVFRVLDATAFYAGIPFSSQDSYYVTTMVYDEIKHIKKNHNALEILLDSKRLVIHDPDIMSEENSELYGKWQALKVLVESLEIDLLKNVKGNKSAGVRARKGLRLLKTEASEIVKLSLSNDKEG